jgi:hypothetical protein
VRSPEAWRVLAAAAPGPRREPWLAAVLARNANCAYLRCYGSPRSLAAFREAVPVTGYEELGPWLDRVRGGEADVLFAGRPAAFERTGGSSGGSKLIPYSADGLDDFRRALLPWLVGAAERHGVTGRVYLSMSPATRQAESIGGMPVGLPEGAYLGAAAAAALAVLTAVPFSVAALDDVERWRSETLRHLRAATDLELISVWSPTFLLALLDGIDDVAAWWPRLKILSCWAAGASRPFADALAARLPQAHLQPKGLLCTECVVTVPDADGRPVLTEHGFFEFERDGRPYLASELTAGAVYSVVATTASGLYRYRTGDLVRCDGSADSGRPVLEFAGRGELVSDLVGEKLTEPFVERCLGDVPGFRLLVPEAEGRGYVLAVEAGAAVSATQIERRLSENPQYAYARRLGQLKPLRLLPVQRLFDRYARAQLREGVRLGEVKPVALRNERAWAARLAEPT